jgi:hypothetical protein
MLITVLRACARAYAAAAPAIVIAAGGPIIITVHPIPDKERP